MLAGDVPHEYDDKYQLVEFIVGMALESTSMTLHSLGFTPLKLAPFIAEASNRTITMRFEAEERCKYLRVETRTVEGATQDIVETDRRGQKTTSKHKTLTKITDHFWLMEIKYGVSLCAGGDSLCVQLPMRRVATEIRTPTNSSAPRPALHRPPAITIDTTFYLQHAQYVYDNEGSLQAFFCIDRLDAACMTPVRNARTAAALQFFEEMHTWTNNVENYLSRSVVALSTQREDLSKILASHEIFVPVLPMLLPHNLANATAPSSLTMSRSAAVSLLAAEMKSLQASLAFVAEQMPTEHCDDSEHTHPSSQMITSQMTQFLLTLRHLRSISDLANKSVMYVEELLRRQLVAAIGREATPADVSQYMQRRNRLLFREEYAPQPLSRAVRRSPLHSPEGFVKLESSMEGDTASSLYTVTRRLFSQNTSNVTASNTPDASHDVIPSSIDPNAVRIRLDSSTIVSLTGEKYVHGALLHEFSTSVSQTLTLTASARQFSSYILMVGRVSSSNSFEPSYAMIVKNKDDVSIPIDLEVIPSLREFNNAISSLSPEQQDFAQAIRALQMESTLFGICVIQIKPQLEKVLNLPRDSLTKQIELTEQLMELFIEYQIPTDFLSYRRSSNDAIENDGNVNSLIAGNASDIAINEIKDNVLIIQAMIARAKEKELQDKRQKDDFHGKNRMHRENVFTEGGVRISAGDSEYEGDYIEMQSGYANAGVLGGDIHLSSGVSSSGNSGKRSFHRRLRGEYEPTTVPSSVPASADAENIAQAFPEQTREVKSAPPLNSLDITSLPDALQKWFEASGTGNIIRPTILTPAVHWTRRRQHNLFSAPITSVLSAEQHASEKKQAYDLLDALTKSGGIEIADSELHVVVTSTHIFDQNLMDTVIQSNINPMQKLEQSMIILACTIFGTNASTLVETYDVGR